MLNDFVEYKKKLDGLLTEIKEDMITSYLTEVNNYIDKVIKIIEIKPSKSYEINVIIERFSEELQEFFVNYNVDKNSNTYIKDNIFKIKILLEIGKEIEKCWSSMCDIEIINTNAEIKLLENILKEDGFFEESN